MIFKILRQALAIAPTAQPSEQRIIPGVNDPIARLFQGDMNALHDAYATPEMRTDRERRRASERAKRKKRLEAIRFFTRGLNTLAEAQVKAMEEANTAPSREKLKDLEDFISRGHKSLVIQADLLFGPENVDKALKEIGYNPFGFRCNAFN
jgi:hypothetical protein